MWITAPVTLGELLMKHSSPQAAFDHVKKDLKQLHRLFRGNLSATKWEKVLRFTDSISKNVPAFYSHLEGKAKHSLKEFVDEFPGYNPNNDPTDLEKFTEVDSTGLSMQKDIDRRLNKLICELNRSSIVAKKAA